jgi:hypothetical protein
MHRIAIFVVTSAAALMVVSTASAAPSGGSFCPADQSGFISWDTSTEPYRVDNAVDRNGNGIACARPTGKSFVEGGVTYPSYNFIDDELR